MPFSKSKGFGKSDGDDHYRGTWDASTNTPFLTDGVGEAGDYYDVIVAGTQDLGSGPITFTVNDEVKYDGLIWYKRDKPETLSQKIKDLSDQLGTGGETSFDIGDTPINPEISHLYYEGQRLPYTTFYNITGSTLNYTGPYALRGYDSGKTTFILVYNSSSTPIGASQKQIYYVGDAGHDGNDGTSIERAFETPTAAAAAIVAQTPSPTNRFELQMIGGMNYTGNINIPNYTTLIGTGEITGDVILGSESHIKINRIVGKITKSTSADAFIECPEINNPTNSAIVQTNGNLYVKADYVKNGGANQCILKTGTSTRIWLDIKHIYSSATNDTVDLSGSAGTAYLNLSTVQKGTVSDAVFKIGDNQTVNGYIGEALPTSGNWLDISDNSILSITANNLQGSVTDDGSNIIDINEVKIPNLETSMATLRTSVTGNGTVYTLPFDNVNKDENITYNPATGISTVIVPGTYIITTAIEMINLNATHTSGRVKLEATSTNPTIHKANYGAMRDSSDNLVTGGSVTKTFAKNDTFKITLQITGGAIDEVNVQIGSTFSAHLVKRGF